MTILYLHENRFCTSNKSIVMCDFFIPFKRFSGELFQNEQQKHTQKIAQLLEHLR